jgi:GDPmannose 4,6-dehydratase
MDRRIALITGITGQTGSYLAELLLSKGYEVHGIIRRSSSFNTERIDHIFDKLHLHYGDLLDPLSLRTIVGKCQPDEVYNLAAQSHVKVSFDQPVYSVETVAMGCLHILEAVRDYRDTTHKEVRFYQASSSEMFGDSPPPQSETTPFRPRSPYACAKVYAYHQTVNYREAYGLFACNGILFNHESPRRGETFVTRKITRAASRIYHGLQSKLYLGNLDAKRDWGYAGDYAEAIWRIMQHETPDDFVVATGHSIAVSAWLALAFTYIDKQWQEHVEIDSKYLRPTEVPQLQGDPRKAQRVLGWKAATSPRALCDMMMKHDLGLAAWEAKRQRFEQSEPIEPIIRKREAEARTIENGKARCPRRKIVG